MEGYGLLRQLRRQRPGRLVHGHPAHGDAVDVIIGVKGIQGPGVGAQAHVGQHQQAQNDPDDQQRRPAAALFQPGAARIFPLYGFVRRLLHEAPPVVSNVDRHRTLYAQFPILTQVRGKTNYNPVTIRTPFGPAAWGCGWSGGCPPLSPVGRRRRLPRRCG